jgi:hypothetical protein
VVGQKANKNAETSFTITLIFCYLNNILDFVVFLFGAKCGHLHYQKSSPAFKSPAFIFK